jgi:hypothetical protein
MFSPFLHLLLQLQLIAISASGNSIPDIAIQIRVLKIVEISIDDSASSLNEPDAEHSDDQVGISRVNSLMGQGDWGQKLTDWTPCSFGLPYQPPVL